ncbi:MAG: hypothetical protein AAFY71_21625 [Bacteroidota bacterium]
MTKTQLRDLQMFNMILECHGWADPSYTEEKLESGQSVKPEGLQVFRNDRAHLIAKFHAPINMIDLSILDNKRKSSVHFHFIYDQAPEKLLDWMVGIAAELDMESFSALIRGAEGKCDMILMEKSEKEIYEFKPAPQL